MTERTLDANRSQGPRRVEVSLNAEYRIQLQQSQRHSGIVQVHRAHLDLLDERLGQCVHVDLEADGQRGFWADARAFTTQRCALDSFMELQCTTPKLLVAEGVKPKDLLPFTNFMHRVLNG